MSFHVMRREDAVWEERPNQDGQLRRLRLHEHRRRDPGVSAQLPQPIYISNHLIGAPAKHGEVRVPQRRDLERKIQGTGLDATPSAADALGPLGFDSLALFARIELEVCRRLALQLLAQGFALASHSGEELDPRLARGGVSGERRPREPLAGGPQRLALVPRQLACVRSVSQREAGARHRALPVDAERLDLACNLLDSWGARCIAGWRGVHCTLQQARQSHGKN